MNPTHRVQAAGDPCQRHECQNWIWHVCWGLWATTLGAIILSAAATHITSHSTKQRGDLSPKAKDLKPEKELEQLKRTIGMETVGSQIRQQAAHNPPLSLLVGPQD